MNAAAIIGRKPVMSLHASGKKGFIEVMVVSDLLFLYFVLFHFVI
jgi:hypothetical protein